MIFSPLILEHYARRLAQLGIEQVIWDDDGDNEESKKKVLVVETLFGRCGPAFVAVLRCVHETPRPYSPEPDLIDHWSLVTVDHDHNSHRGMNEGHSN